MCCCELKTILEIIQSAFTIGAIVLGGLWVLYLYKRQREDHAHIEFTADIVFHKKIGEWWIVELVAYLENKGKIRHTMNDIFFKADGIGEGEQVELTTKYRNQVFFPHVVAEGSFLPEGKKQFFMEPGVKNKYSFVTRVRATDDAVIFHTWFHYPKSDRMHVAETTKVVPK